MEADAYRLGPSGRFLRWPDEGILVDLVPSAARTQRIR